MDYETFMRVGMCLLGIGATVVTYKSGHIVGYAAGVKRTAKVYRELMKQELTILEKNMRPPAGGSDNAKNY